MTGLLTENIFKSCFTAGFDFGETANFTYNAKMQQFLAIMGSRKADAELEELILWTNQLGIEANAMLFALTNGSNPDKKRAIYQFVSGYIKGKRKENL